MCSLRSHGAAPEGRRCQKRKVHKETVGFLKKLKPFPILLIAAKQ